MEDFLTWKCPGYAEHPILLGFLQGEGTRWPWAPPPLPPPHQPNLYLFNYIYLFTSGLWPCCERHSFNAHSYGKQGTARLPLPIAASLLLPARFMISRENLPFCEKSSTVLQLLWESNVQNATAGDTENLIFLRLDLKVLKHEIIIIFFT
jgi:hypothetical protein